jgi:ubiquinone/menaquinone biosynthesis C-methylase UbiE
MPNDRESTYRFGDSTLAAERLRLLAAAFEPSSRSFLERLRPRAPRMIADLGCGPGHTTKMFADVFPSAHVLGIDSSENFLSIARREHNGNVEFALADVTRPFTDGPFDLMYARYLLTHLSNCKDTIAGWARQLAQGGCIAIEENHWIETENPAFREYLEIVNAMLRADGKELFVGAGLEALESWPELEKTASDLARVELRASVAASLFLPNLRSWRSQTFIRQNFKNAVLDGLECELQALARDTSNSPAITFGVRQIMLQLSCAVHREKLVRPLHLP